MRIASQATKQLVVNIEVEGAASKKSRMCSYLVFCVFKKAPDIPQKQDREDKKRCKAWFAPYCVDLCVQKASGWLFGAVSNFQYVAVLHDVVFAFQSP